jgi:hypothetical protein
MIVDTSYLRVAIEVEIGDIHEYNIPLLQKKIFGYVVPPISTKLSALQALCLWL